MKLIDMVPSLRPEQLANCEVRVHVNWDRKEVAIALVNENNEALAVKKLETPKAAPKLMNQGDFWKVNHNAWLDLAGLPKK